MMQPARGPALTVLVSRVRWILVVLGLVQALLAGGPGGGAYLAVTGAMAAYNLAAAAAPRWPARWLGRLNLLAFSGDLAAALFWLAGPPGPKLGISELALALVGIEAAVVFQRRGVVLFATALGVAVLGQLAARPGQPALAVAGDVVRGLIVILVAVLAALRAGEGTRLRDQDRQRSARLEILARFAVRVSQQLERAAVVDSAISALLELFPDRWHGVVLEGRLAASTEGRQEPFHRSRLELALEARGRRLGTLVVADAGRRAFSGDERSFLEAVAGQLATALENARLYQEVAALSLTDAVTGLPNRRAFDKRLQEEVERARRYSAPLALMMIDVDHFKHYNDTHGHRSGDVVLRMMGGLLEAGGLREVDLPFRYGGEEFAVLMPNTGVREALGVAERLCTAVARAGFPYAEAQPGGRFTISAGVAGLPGRARTSGELVAESDRALYAAKRAGRARAMAAGPGLERVPDRA